MLAHRQGGPLQHPPIINQSLPCVNFHHSEIHDNRDNLEFSLTTNRREASKHLAFIEFGQLLAKLSSSASASAWPPRPLSHFQVFPIIQRQRQRQRRPSKFPAKDISSTLYNSVRNQRFPIHFVRLLVSFLDISKSNESTFINPLKYKYCYQSINWRTFICSNHLFHFWLIFYR